jgi:hypothetical protein
MYRRWLAGLTLVAGMSSGARAAVLFENPGNTMGWGRVYTQRGGNIAEVSSPVYQGTTAVRTTQTYMTSDGANYHSEMVKNTSQLADQDLYYGHAIWLPADWQFHEQNVTFQQWAPEDPAGPWILMFVQGDKLRVGGRGIEGLPVLASITNLRGTWIRVVTRLKMSTAGTFEVWVNGMKTLTQNGDFRAMGPSLRWSAGIYCTRWDTELPTGQKVLSIFHDSMRVTTTLDEADPASWSGGTMMPPPADAGAEGGIVAPDAGPDVGAPDSTRLEPDAAGNATGGISGTGGSGGTGGRGTGGAPATGGSAGSEPEPEQPPPSRAKSSGGCAVAGPSGQFPALLAPLAALALRRRRRR